jgi:hypothetical protein
MVDVQFKMYICGPINSKRAAQHNIEIGMYDLESLAKLIREHRNDPDAIRFIADMIEE